MQMKEAAAGLTFTVTMSGDFALGETDPRAPSTTSRGARSELAIHVTVHIDDIERFIADAAHTGRLTGHVSSPLLGGDVPATHGVFNLFSPTDDPALTLMIYELAFRHDGKAYYLAGRKEVRDDPGFDLWADTTTLFTTLHEGSDRTGPVAGAGILRLGAGELLKLVRSMRATNTDSLGESARVVQRFGAFFLRSLWESYGPKRDGGEARAE
jgi:choline dehydrogenase-like flavoprotein